MRSVEVKPRIVGSIVETISALCLLGGIINSVIDGGGYSWIIGIMFSALFHYIANDLHVAKLVTDRCVYKAKDSRKELHKMRFDIEERM